MLDELDKMLNDNKPASFDAPAISPYGKIAYSDDETALRGWTGGIKIPDLDVSDIMDGTCASTATTYSPNSMTLKDIEDAMAMLTKPVSLGVSSRGMLANLPKPSSEHAYPFGTVISPVSSLEEAEEIASQIEEQKITMAYDPSIYNDYSAYITYTSADLVSGGAASGDMSFTVANPVPDNVIRISNDNGSIDIGLDGTIEFNGDINVSAGAQLFWDAVSVNAPRYEDTIQKLEAEVVELKEELALIAKEGYYEPAEEARENQIALDFTIAPPTNATDMVTKGYDPYSIEEDFFFGSRPGSRGTQIETLPGGQGLGELEDLEYFRRKVTDAMKLPDSYFEGDIAYAKAREVRKALLQHEVLKSQLETNKTFMVDKDSSIGKLMLKNLRAETFDDAMELLK
jgi:hypothetical protein